MRNSSVCTCLNARWLMIDCTPKPQGISRVKSGLYCSTREARSFQNHIETARESCCTRSTRGGISRKRFGLGEYMWYKSKMLIRRAHKCSKRWSSTVIRRGLGQCKLLPRCALNDRPSSAVRHFKRAMKDGEKTRYRIRLSVNDREDCAYTRIYGRRALGRRNSGMSLEDTLKGARQYEALACCSNGSHTTHALRSTS